MCHLTRVHIGHIVCSEAVAEKIASKHGVDLQEVRDAVQWPARPSRAAWLDDSSDPRGPRLAVEGHTGQRGIRAVLYPVDPDDGTWRLGTAVPMV